MAGLDVERASAAGTTPEHQAALVYQWSQITRVLGADLEPRAITYDLVQRYVATRRAEGALGQTIVREVAALKRATTEAHDRGWLAVTPKRWPVVRRDPSGEKRTGKLHPPAILAQWMASLPQDARDKAIVATLTSLRDAELGRITAQWVEPAPPGLGVEAVLRVPARSVKGRREKLLPLVPAVLEVLRRRATTVGPGAPLLPGNHKRAYATARRVIGYEPTISHRDLRHTWATLAAGAEGVHAARGMLGHASLATTSRYVHATLEGSAAAALAVEGLVVRVGSAEVSESGAGNGARTHDPQLGKLTRVAWEHLLACKSCRDRVLACTNLRVIVGDVGRGDSAEEGRR